MAIGGPFQFYGFYDSTFVQHLYESCIDLHAEICISDSANARNITSITLLELQQIHQSISANAVSFKLCSF